MSLPAMLGSALQECESRDDHLVQVHAEGEAEHAAIGHNAVASFAPRQHLHLLRQAMQDHDRDFSRFYNALADMLE